MPARRCPNISRFYNPISITDIGPIIDHALIFAAINNRFDDSSAMFIQKSNQARFLIVLCPNAGIFYK